MTKIEEDDGNRPELRACFRMVVIEDRVAGHQIRSGGLIFRIGFWGMLY